MNDTAKQVTQSDKEKILSTPARRKLYQARMEGKNIKESAQIAGVSYKYARDICAGIASRCVPVGGINAIRLEITAERQLREYDDIKRLAKDAGDYTAARMALDNQSHKPCLSRIYNGYDIKTFAVNIEYRKPNKNPVKTAYV